MTHLIYVILALQIADVISTLYAFRNGAVEANPIMRRLIAALGPVPGLLVPKGAFVALVWLYRDQLHIWGILAVAAVYVVVVWRNLQIARSKRA